MIKIVFDRSIVIQRDRSLYIIVCMTFTLTSDQQIDLELTHGACKCVAIRTYYLYVKMIEL